MLPQAGFLISERVVVHQLEHITTLEFLIFLQASVWLSYFLVSYEVSCTVVHTSEYRVVYVPENCVVR